MLRQPKPLIKSISTNPKSHTTIPHTRSILILLCPFLAACQHQSDPTADPLALLPPAARTVVWTGPDGADHSSSWIASFESPSLAQLIAAAESNNFTLSAQNSLADAAQAAARINRSLRLPSLGLSLRSSRSQSVAPLATLQTFESETHRIALAARWEIDLWNRLGSRAKSSELEADAALADRDAFRLSLKGQVAKTWIALVAARAQERLARANDKSLQQNLNTLENRFQRGLSNAFDLRLARSQLASNRALLQQRISQADTLTLRLETLLGRYPNAALAADPNLPDLPPIPAAGIPAQLLDRRPDLRAGARRLSSAFSLDTAQQRNWLPDLTLTASNGTLAPRFSQILDGDFSVWDLAASLNAALFQGGSLKAARAQSAANREAAQANFQALVLDAFREVETALRTEIHLGQELRQLEIAATESSAAEGQSLELYQRGLLDITGLLDAQRRAFDAQSRVLQSKAALLQNRVDLHLALGGDFSATHNESDSPPAP